MRRVCRIRPGAGTCNQHVPCAAMVENKRVARIVACGADRSGRGRPGQPGVTAAGNELAFTRRGGGTMAGMPGFEIAAAGRGDDRSRIGKAVVTGWQYLAVPLPLQQVVARKSAPTGNGEIRRIDAVLNEQSVAPAGKNQSIGIIDPLFGRWGGMKPEPAHRRHGALAEATWFERWQNGRSDSRMVRRALGCDAADGAGSRGRALAMASY